MVWAVLKNKSKAKGWKDIKFKTVTAGRKRRNGPVYRGEWKITFVYKMFFFLWKANRTKQLLILLDYRYLLNYTLYFSPVVFCFLKRRKNKCERNPVLGERNKRHGHKKKDQYSVFRTRMQSEGQLSQFDDNNSDQDSHNSHYEALTMC